MDHSRAIGLLDEYFRGTLDRETTRDLHKHFNECEDCKVRLRATRSSLVARRGASAAPEPDTLQETLRRNRTMTYVVLVIMLCFFFFFRLWRR
ncbi:MAG: zf-HC2 domain-containing protein [candidate division FCPU426 bacterium]